VSAAFNGPKRILVNVSGRRHQMSQRLFERLRAWIRLVRQDVVALFHAARDPRVPWYAKAVAAAVAAYALSPIDLIPDFVPVLGYLDDLVLVPLGIAIAVRLIPPEIMAEHRRAAATAPAASRAGAIAIIVAWVAGAVFLTWLFWPRTA
jgi:uncharacterized membrane protein YkvA (DUF1232 family)